MCLVVLIASSFLDAAVGRCSLPQFSAPLSDAFASKSLNSLKQNANLTRSLGKIRRALTADAHATTLAGAGVSSGCLQGVQIPPVWSSKVVNSAWHRRENALPHPPLNNLCAAHWTALNSLLAFQKCTLLCSVHWFLRHACGAAAAQGKQGHDCEGEDCRRDFWHTYENVLWDMLWMLSTAFAMRDGRRRKHTGDRFL